MQTNAQFLGTLRMSASSPVVPSATPTLPPPPSTPSVEVEHHHGSYAPAFSAPLRTDTGTILQCLVYTFAFITLVWGGNGSPLKHRGPQAFNTFHNAVTALGPTMFMPRRVRRRPCERETTTRSSERDYDYASEGHGLEVATHPGRPPCSDLGARDRLKSRALSTN